MMNFKSIQEENRKKGFIDYTRWKMSKRRQLDYKIRLSNLIRRNDEVLMRDYEFKKEI